MGMELRNELPQQRGTILFHGLVDIFLPQNPAIPINEGVHCLVTDGHDATDTPRETLVRLFEGLGVAKSVASGPWFPEQPWSNTRIEEGNAVSVYGRNAFDPDSWRKPVVAQNRQIHHGQSMPQKTITEWSHFLQTYIPKWEALGKTMHLFRSGEGEIGKDTHFQLGHGVIVYQTEKYDVLIHDARPVGEFAYTEDGVRKIRDRNIGHTDIHFVISARNGYGYEQQWQTLLQDAPNTLGQDGERIQPFIAETIEMNAIALGIRDLMGFGGEIHNSGNWAKGLKSTDTGGHLNLNELLHDPIKEKRSHRPDLGDGYGTTSYTHLYATYDGRPVELPKMKREEALAFSENSRLPEEMRAYYREIVNFWDSIPATLLSHLSKDNLTMDGFIDIVKASIGNGQLNTWLHENVSGLLIQ